MAGAISDQTTVFSNISITGTLAVDSAVVTSGYSASRVTAGALIAQSSFSLGVGGSPIAAISSISSLVGAFVVQPSSSSFTGIAWPAAKVGDVILVSPYQSGAVSSVSSGLVPWSHVTVAGQVEFRLSNVSTLAQNQSAQSWVFVRISAF